MQSCCVGRTGGTYVGGCEAVRVSLSLAQYSTCPRDVTVRVEGSIGEQITFDDRGLIKLYNDVETLVFNTKFWWCYIINVTDHVDTSDRVSSLSGLAFKIRPVCVLL